MATVTAVAASEPGVVAPGAGLEVVEAESCVADAGSSTILTRSDVTVTTDDGACPGVMAGAMAEPGEGTDQAAETAADSPAPVLVRS